MINNRRKQVEENKTMLAGNWAGLLPPSVYESYGLRSGGLTNVNNEIISIVNIVAAGVSNAAINWSGEIKDNKMVPTPALLRQIVINYLVSGSLVLEGNKNGIDSPTAFIYRQGKAVIKETQTQPPDSMQTAIFSDRFLTIKERTGKEEQIVFNSYVGGSYFLYCVEIDEIPLLSQIRPAVKRWLRSAINRNYVGEIAAFPERVIYSDEYLQLARSSNTQDVKLFEQLKKISPRQLKILPTGGKYEITSGANLEQFIELEEKDRQALYDFFYIENLSGGNLTEVAIAERQSRHRAFINTLCSLIADFLTNALKQEDKADNDFNLTIKPHWESLNDKKIAQISRLYEIGLLSRSNALLELQDIYKSITDEEINAADESF